MPNQNTHSSYFSVVIPLYNKEKEIKRAIDSVLNQTFQDFELIVVNDESTDNSLSVVESIQDSRITIISQENKGEFGARNTGIINSHAPYIAFLDGDDEWKPEFLETIYRLTLEFPQVGLYCTSRLYQYSSKSIRGKHTSGINRDGYGVIQRPFLSWAEDRMAPMSCSSSVVPRKVFEKVGLFQLKRGAGGDWEMWCRILLHYQIAYAAKYMVLVHSEGKNRLSNIRSNLSMKEHYVTELFQREDNYIQEYMRAHSNDIERYLDFIEPVHLSLCINSGGDRREIMHIIHRIHHPFSYWKNIVYGIIMAHLPCRYRDLVSCTFLRIYNLFT